MIDSTTLVVPKVTITINVSGASSPYNFTIKGADVSSLRITGSSGSFTATKGSTITIKPGSKTDYTVSPSSSQFVADSNKSVSFRYISSLTTLTIRFRCKDRPLTTSFSVYVRSTSGDTLISGYLIVDVSYDIMWISSEEVLRGTYQVSTYERGYQSVSTTVSTGSYNAIEVTALKEYTVSLNPTGPVEGFLHWDCWADGVGLDPWFGGINTSYTIYEGERIMCDFEARDGYTVTPTRETFTATGNKVIDITIAPE